jgi:hypothetical protein
MYSALMERAVSLGEAVRYARTIVVEGGGREALPASLSFVLYGNPGVWLRPPGGYDGSINRH